jgi:DNA-binding MurR/RpiR family transcriptional regulator
MQPKQTFEELKQEISAQHAKLSKRLRQIAEFAVAEPDQTALETVASIAAKAKVPPSSLIRFAKHFGYDGFTDMQRVFRSRLIDRASSYNQRIRDYRSGQPSDLGSPFGVLQHFIEADISALQRLGHEIRPLDLARAIRLLAAADVVGVVAQRRSFPVAAYLSYALSHLGRRALLIDGIGGMQGEQLRILTARDTVIAVSFKPYAPETLSTIAAARERGLSVIAITDSALSPLGPVADVCFEIEEAQVQGIRSLTPTLCLAVSLVVGLGQQLEGGTRGRAAKRRSAGEAERAAAPARAESGGRARRG